MRADAVSDKKLGGVRAAGRPGLVRRLKREIARHGFGYTALAIVGALVGGPALAVVLMSLRLGIPGRGGALTLENYGRAYSDPIILEVLLNTTLFALGTVSVSLLFTLPLVWLFNRTDLPGKQGIFVVLIASFLVPVFLRAIGWILLFSPEVGMFNTLARSLLGIERPLFNLYNIPGMAFVQGLSLVPASFFMLSAAFRAMDPALEEASYTSGAGRLRTILRINIPVSWPAIVAVMVYMLMLAVSLFEVPAIVGWPARIFVLSSLIYFAVTPNVGLPKYGVAGAYGLLMMALGLLLAYLYFRVIRETRRYQVVTGRGYRPKELRLGRWKYAALAFVAVYVALDFVLPFVALLWVSLLPHAQAFSLEALSKFTLVNYRQIPELIGPRPFINTMILVLLVPTLSMTLSILVSWVVTRQRFRLGGILDAFAFLPHAVPHILFAVALAYLALVFRNVLPIYGSVFIIVVAHATAYLAYGTRTMNGAMIQIHHELEESGRVCGSSKLRVLWRIVIPLMAGAAFNAWLWISLLSYREVTMALLLRGPDNVVLATLIWQLWFSGLAPEVGALGVVLIAAIVPLAWMARSLFATLAHESSGAR
jgi:iron(III) transport system permease protein